MADESIIVEQPEMEYETVDIIENDEKAQITSETLDIIDVEDVKVFTVETDEAFASLGEQNEELKHQHFTGRDFPDQHPIIAITGLRAELDSIEALQTIYSNEKQAADYYEWSDGNILSENRVGYFVSLCQDVRTIKICKGEDIFGVTVDNAAFVGGQDDVSRDGAYGLVAHTGIVNVRCESNVKVGDYVISNNYGVAEKSNNDYGCKVIALHNVKGVLNCVILLNMSIDQINAMGYELKNIDQRLDAAETNIVTAINVANKAYNLAEGSVKTSEGASQKADDAVNKANNAMSIIDRSEKQIQEAIKVSVEAKVIADSAVVSAEAIRSEAVAMANEKLAEVTQKVQSLHNEINEFEDNVNSKVDNMEESVDELSGTVEKMQTDINDLQDKTVDNLDEMVNDIKYAKDLADRLNNNLQTAVGDIQTLSDELEPLSSWPEGSDYPTGIAGFVAKADENSATLADIVTWKDGDGNDSLVGVISKATADNAELQALASYGYIDDDGVKHYGAAGIMAEVDKNASSIEAIVGTDGSLAGLQEKVDQNSASITTLASHTIGEYISVDTWNQAYKDTNKVYYAIDTKLYWYYDEEWKSTDKSYEAGLDGTLSGIQQIADDNKAQLDMMVEYDKDGKSALVGLTSYVDENSANFSQLAKYSNKDSGRNGIAGLVADVDENTSALSVIADYTNEETGTTGFAGLMARVDDTKSIVETVADYTYIDKNGNEIIGLAGLRSQVDKNKSEVALVAEKTTANYEAIIGVQGKADKNEASIETLASFKYGNDLKIYPYFDSPKNNEGQYGGDVIINDITFTDKGNHTITITGTTNEKADFYLVKDHEFTPGEYSISGYPEGSSTTTCCIKITKTSTNDTDTTLENTNGESTFTVESGDLVSVWIRVVGDTSEENITFTPCFKQFFQGVAGLKDQVTKNGSSIDLLTSFSSDNGEGVAGLITQVSGHEAQLQALTTWKGDASMAIADVQEKADNNESSINAFSRYVSQKYMIISDYFEDTDKTKKDISKLYYHKPNKFYYYESGAWQHTTTYNKFNTETIYYVSATKYYYYYKNNQWNRTKDSYTAGLRDTIAGLQISTDINSAEISQITSWQGDTNSSIARIQQIANNNGASINMMVSTVNTYVVGEYSQAYGLTYEQSQQILKEGMIYIPTKHGNNTTHTETYRSNNSSNTYTYEFTETYYYTWNGASWNESASGTVTFSKTAPTLASNSILKYWYVNSETAPTNYEAMTLYKAENQKWVKVGAFSKNRSISSISQEVDNISINVTNAQGSIAALNARVGDNEASVESLALWSKGGKKDGEQYNLATIKQTADTNGARIAQVVSGVSGKDVVILTEAWNSKDKDTNKVYYVKPAGLYYYYKNSKWNSTTSTDGAGLKINAASIVTAINNSGSSIVLSADKINLNGAITTNNNFTIDKSGCMRAVGGSIAGWTFTATRLGSDKTDKQRKYLIIGDSYSCGYYVDSSGKGQYDRGGWPYRLLTKLGLATTLPDKTIYDDDKTSDKDDTYLLIKSDNYVILGKGGIGFAEKQSDGNDKYNFEELVKDRINGSLSSFTDIIIACGWNDQWYGSRNSNDEWVMTDSNVPSGMTNFNDYVKNTKGFTGKITLFGIGDCCGKTDNTTQANADIRLKGLYTSYKTQSKTLGWTFVDLKSWDEDDAKYYGSDNFHPNPEGYERIATLIYYTWVTGYGRLYHNPQGFKSKTRGFYLSNHPSDSWAIQIGTPNSSFADVGGNNESNHRQFLVSHDGELWAQGAHINGTIVSTSGKIGGWTIENSKLSCENINTAGTNGFGVSIRVPSAKGNTETANTVIRVKDITNGTSSYPFTLYSDGTLVATKANITGTVTAGSGSIGGWNINTGKISAGDGSTLKTCAIQAPASGRLWVFAAGGSSHSSYADCPFRVDKNGNLYATSATITGKITATSGNFSNDVTIGGTSITAGKLRQLYRAAREGYDDADSLQIKRIDATSGSIGDWSINESSLFSSYEENGCDYFVKLTPRDLKATVDGRGGTETWYMVYAAARWYKNNYSDERLKTDIESLSDKYEYLFDTLQPKRYKYINGTSSRYHTGFIAQEVMNSVNNAGLTSQDFAAACLEGVNGNEGYWFLRRDEFVALNTWQIQKAKARISELEARVAELEARIKGE